MDVEHVKDRVDLKLEINSFYEILEECLVLYIVVVIGVLICVDVVLRLLLLFILIFIASFKDLLRLVDLIVIIFLRL
mgnify:CR=1 FL=1